MTFSNSKSMDVIQLLFQQKEAKEHERPPPYSYSTLTGVLHFQGHLQAVSLRICLHYIHKVNSQAMSHHQRSQQAVLLRLCACLHGWR